MSTDRRSTKLTTSLWLILNGDRREAERQLARLFIKIRNNKLTKQEREIIADGLWYILDSRMAPAFFNFGIMPRSGIEIGKHLDAFHYVNLHREQGYSLDIAIGKAAADMNYIPDNASDEKREEYLRQLKSDYKQGQLEVRNYLDDMELLELMENRSTD